MAKNFHFQYVLPLRPANVNLRCLSQRRFQQAEAIVLHLRYVPEESVRATQHFAGLSQQIAHQIQQVNPLFEKDTASREFPIRVPLFLVSGTATVSETGA